MKANIDRVERLLAMILLSTLGYEAGQVSKAAALRTAGFTTVEIADLLGTTSKIILHGLNKAKSRKP